MDINYSVSFGDNTQATKPPTLWAFCGVDLLPAPDDAVLLRRLEDDRRHLVRRDVAAVLDHCREFASLKDHADRAGDVVPALKGHPEHAMPVLQQMADLGFLRSSDALIGKWQAPAPTTEPLPQVFVITCDRPEALRRLLDSLAADPGNEGYDITVVDDSREANAQRRNAELVAKAGQSTDLAVNYFGMAEREQLLAALIDAVPEHSAAVRFLLDRQQWPDIATYGLSRNLALLLSAGKRIIVLDDDILAEARPAPGQQSGLSFGSVNSRRLAFFEDQQSMLNGHMPMNASPLTLSSELLGIRLGQLVGLYSPTAAALAGANGSAWWPLDKNAPVLMTQCGTFGDPGTGAKAHWIVNLPKDDLERLLSLETPIGDTLGKQATWMGYHQLTAMRFGVMSAVTGLDNRQLLPPYLPVLRGEDFLFAVMAEKMHPTSLVLGLPWAVPHLPVDARSTPTLEGKFAAPAGIRLFADWVDSRVTTGNGDPAQILTQLAQHTEDLCGSSPEAILMQAQGAMATQHLRQLEQVNRCLKAVPQGHSAEWDAFLQRAQQELINELQQPITANGLLDRHSKTDLATLAHYGADLAAALVAWPRLVAAARAL